MRNLIRKSLLIALIVCAVLANLETGLVNVNLQFNLQAINKNSNTVCFTQIFRKPFSSKPQISTALTVFDIQNSQNYQLSIRNRKSELTQTEAKFLVFARQELGLWKKVSFTYFATDRTDIIASVYYAETVDLSGCGKVLSQEFSVPIIGKSIDAQITIFLTGFDLTTTIFEGVSSLFELQLQKMHYKDQILTVSISRQSPVQIYSVSFSYIVVNMVQDASPKIQTFYNSQRVDFSQEKPENMRWKQVKHDLDLTRGGQIYGFSHFRFGNQGNRRKELALSFTDKHVLFGSKEKTELQHACVNYMVIREKLICKENEAIIYSSKESQYKCQICSKEENRVPNAEKNACICMENHFVFQSRCMAIPENSVYSQEKKSYVCEKGYEWLHYKKQDRIFCKVPPAFSTWNNEIQQFICIENYHIVDGGCQTVGENEFYNPDTKAFMCIVGSQRVQTKCVKPHENEVWSKIENKFVCIEGAFRIGALCLFPPKNMKYSTSDKMFVCIQKYYSVSENACEIIPQGKIYNSELKRLECQKGLYDVSNNCKPLPPNCQYSEKDKVFNCVAGAFKMTDGSCQKPQQNEEYSAEIKEFICKASTYKVQGKCFYPIKNASYSPINKTFVCNLGFYRIGFECLAPPENYFYSEKTKSFKCLDGFYKVNEACIKIPPNKVYSQELKKFICVNNYFQLTNGNCQRPGINQKFDIPTKSFICIDGYFRIDGECKELPSNCTYDAANKSFRCNEGFYKKSSDCLPCKESCLACQSIEKCVKCARGFEPIKAICSQKCGDGIRFVQQCDDGNTLDGDGCSSRCTVEEGWICGGGSSTTPDFCKRKTLTSTPSVIVPVPSPPSVIVPVPPIITDKNMELRMVGLSHLYGKIILNVKMNYVPPNLLQSTTQIHNMFKVLTNCRIPMAASTMFIKGSAYTFVVLYDFNVEPIPEFLTRVELAAEIQQKYFNDWKVRPLFIKIDPAVMARKGNNGEDILN